MRSALLGLLCLAISAITHAASLNDGSYTVRLQGGSETLDIGSLQLSRQGDTFTFTFAMDETKFSDQFLSMRPFKCLDGDVMICHLAYPYQKNFHISSADLIDLEYEFLFIARSPSEYGIDPYNGRYYKLSIDDGEIKGTIYAVDLNLLAAPPEDGDLRPLTHDLLDELEIERQRFGEIRIFQSR